ncbi:hypothetical protein HOK021_69060 [Streptomyces hygroscopicus]|nr:hypothetical protein HOK021_69060 [Streptomyces hygroscopicus]
MSDTHPALPARLLAPADSGGGRGLVLVDVMAVRWGVTEHTGPGKTVWAEVDLPAETGAVHPG